MWRWIWRLVGLGGFVLSAICCFFLYELWKFGVLKAVVAGKPVEQNFDVISFQIDVLSLTLAVVGVALGVVGLFGYQTIKDVAVDRAAKEAADEARRVVQEIYGIDENKKGTYIFVKRGSAESRDSAMVEQPNSARPHDFDPASVSTAGAVREEPGTEDDEPEGSHGDNR